MKITKPAIAGTLESSDLMVKVTPNQNGMLEVVVRSEVIKQFGKQIRRVIDDTLSKLEVSEGTVVVEDKGALDYAIQARVQAAVLRGAGSEELNWEQLS
ncbi:MAG TPA: citrate lyase acyl carrier protein [Terriglobales bacterium]|nr:citrate lyase acyl carrier protein [Terriglobales bacterium]